MKAFEQGGALKVGMDERTETCWRGFALVPGLLALVQELGLASPEDHEMTVAGSELVLEALTARQRIARSEEYGWQRPKPARRRPKPGTNEEFNL